MTDNKGLPVAGYTVQTNERVALVNANKRLEESVLCALDLVQANPDFDKRWLAIARTNIEQGFMAFNRAIFRPERVKLPEDRADG
ncbi:MAG: hypothetical protein J0L51_07185 [Rhizobiales bacterium]|nr:hypothetical protein [Hyphomicrobiales bacterium]